VEFTSQVSHSCINVNNLWNTCKLVFTGNRIQIPGIVLMSMQTWPYNGPTNNVDD